MVQLAWVWLQLEVHHLPFRVPFPDSITFSSIGARPRVANIEDDPADS
jgi:hypothetical protein